MSTTPINIIFVGAIAWLLEPTNNFVTGQVIAVDGGLGSLQPRFVQSTTSRS